MANYISKINIAGVVYDIYDKEARDLLAKTLVFVGVTTTAVSDGATTPATYGGLSGITIPPGHVAGDPLDAGTVVIYNQKEFVWDGSKWAEFGDLSDLSLSTTTGNFVTGVTATPTNTATNTGAGSAHSHTIGSATTKHLIISAQKEQALVTQAQSGTVAANVATGTLSTTSGTGKGAGVVTDLTMRYLGTETFTPTTAGTAVPVFNSITSTQGTDGVKIITEVSGGGQAGEVITAGVAAVLAPTVATGIATSNATATGRIAYTAGVTATNKMVTANVTPAAVGTAVSAAYFAGGSPYLVATTSTNNTRYLSRGLQTVSSNSDGTNTNTLNLLSVVCNGVTDTDSADNPALDSDYQLLRNPGVQQVKYNNITPAVAGTQITYATGALATNGSGSAVATGGTTSYLYLNTSSQTTNTPTVVSFGTVVINGTPSYIHTSNITPATGIGTPITYVTGDLWSTSGTNRTAASFATAYTTKYMELATQSITLAPTVATGQTNISGSGAYLVSGIFVSLGDTTGGDTYGPFVTAIPSVTGQESAHTHSYSKATAISVSAPTASAITSVSLTPAS